jgi:hypothetical protein
MAPSSKIIYETKLRMVGSSRIICGLRTVPCSKIIWKVSCSKQPVNKPEKGSKFRKASEEETKNDSK